MEQVEHVAHQTLKAEWDGLGFGRHLNGLMQGLEHASLISLTRSRNVKGCAAIFLELGLSQFGIHSLAQA